MAYVSTGTSDLEVAETIRSEVGLPSKRPMSKTAKAVIIGLLVVIGLKIPSGGK